MKRFLSALLAMSVMLALIVPASAANYKVRTPGKFEITVLVEAWGENGDISKPCKVTFDQCYGTIQYPGWGPIPVVREDSKMHVEFPEGPIGDCYYAKYKIRQEESSWNPGQYDYVYYDPATNETINDVICLQMGYQWWDYGDEDTGFNFPGPQEPIEDVVNGRAFGVEGENKFWYKMYNGMREYKLDVECDNNRITLDMPTAYYALAINDNQIKQFMNNGVMTFPAPAGFDPEQFTWSCTFPKTNMRAILFEGFNPVNYTNPSSWAAENVTRADEIKITDHLADSHGNTYYTNNISRGAFAAMIVKILAETNGINIEEIATNASKNKEVEFDDISMYSYNGPEMYAAAALGIVNGVGNNEFAPSRFITRQEIAVMFYRALKYVESQGSEKYVTGASTDTSAYSDSAKIASWAKEGVGALVNLGIINGVTATEISPLTNTTIEQAIALAMRVFDLISK